MVIDPNSGLNSIGTGGARNRTSASINTSSGNDAPARTPTPSAADNVSLSGQAHALQRLETSISAAPEVDSARVAQIKEAIANGSFEINADRIAERMLNNDDLLN